MKWIYNDGGRSFYYKAPNVKDCVCRAIAIANNKDYKVVYNTLKLFNNGQSPRNGMYESVYSKLLKSWGWKPISCEKKNIHLKEDELPDGIIICKIDHHLVAVKNKIIYDTWDCSKVRKGKHKGEPDRVKVIKYWVKDVA
jgi:hypothetical protein